MPSTGGVYAVTMPGWRWATSPSWRSENDHPVLIRIIVSLETPVWG